MPETPKAPNAATKRDDSIHQACRVGDLDSVKRFVAEDPFLVDADDEHHWRPIFHAALRRHAEVVRFLIDAGADVGAHNGDALHYGSQVPGNDVRGKQVLGKQRIVRMLVENGSLDAHTLPIDNRQRQFLAAIFLANEPRVQAMLRLEPSLATTPDGRGDHPIHHAARNGDTGIVRALIQHGADVGAVTDRNHTVLYCAGGHGHLETVEVLLDAGADPALEFTRDGKTLREWLAQYPDDARLRPVAELLDARTDP